MAMQFPARANTIAAPTWQCRRPPDKAARHSGRHSDASLRSKRGSRGYEMHTSLASWSEVPRQFDCAAHHTRRYHHAVASFQGQRCDVVRHGETERQKQAAGCPYTSSRVQETGFRKKSQRKGLSNLLPFVAPRRADCNTQRAPHTPRCAP